MGSSAARDDARDDATLIAGARSGDADAFARLVARYRRDALRLAYALAGDEAEDVAQEAFVKAYRNLHQLHEGASLRPWLLTVVANEARNRLRSRGRRQHLAVRVAGRRGDEVADPGDVAVRTERRERLLAAVLELDEPAREIVALRWFAGLTEAEIAAALDCPLGTVKSRSSRALARLRRALGEEARP